jgi:hypothetical protein
VLYGFYIATYRVDPPPPSQDGTVRKISEPSEKDKITWGIIGIVAAISISMEIPTFIHSIKKSKRIKEEINNECINNKNTNIMQNTIMQDSLTWL